MKRIILITGGERSGKSVYAEQLALSLSDRPVYMATARIWDEEFRQRVGIHRERRGPQWTNIEEDKYLSRHDLTGRTVLIDCVTLWATNFFFDYRPAPGSSEDAETDTVERRQARAGIRQVEDTLQTVKEEFLRFTAQDSVFIFVTNEIGMGGVSPNEVQLRFTDLLGWTNQFVAAQADEVYLMVSGIPVKIK
ncbi:MAG: bifunctional adenosylcobinamide kinase/adenosylcobinamide-phosphate guanylyltransferase [Paraprevotella sp.]|nr:bifunctional adenosylcobinamide kinase/adenosylcobinamide-phosphate guanylyltransferase [Paraprevotella sp.]